jgi:hypothetical protein
VNEVNRLQMKNMTGRAGGYRTLLSSSALIRLLLVLSGAFVLDLNHTADAAPVVAVPANDLEKGRFDEEIAQRLRSLVQQDIAKYCTDGCTILGIDVDSREVFDTSSSALGFETAPAGPRNFIVRRAAVEILIDNRLGKDNIDRVQDVLLRSSKRYGMPVDLEFTRTTLPDSPQVIRAEAEAKSEVVDRVRSSLDRLMNDFCPVDCRLQSVDLKTAKIPLDEVQSSMARRAVVIRESKNAIIVSGITVDLLIDSEMTEQRRSRIENLFQEHIDTYGRGVLNVKLAKMPKSAKEIQKDADEAREDPWGLERLGKALRIFKEFANTKEIIRERDTLNLERERETDRQTERQRERETERESERQKEREKESEREKRSESSLESNLSTQSSTLESAKTNNTLDSQKTNSSDSFWTSWTQEKVLLVGGLIGLLVLIAALGLRFVLTGKQVQHLISEGRGGATAQSGFGDEVAEGLRTSAEPNSENAFVRPAQPLVVNGIPARARPALLPHQSISDEVAQAMNIQSLRDELTQSFIAQPKVARDVFSRVLREDGIEFAAKCVSVLGEILVYDLMSDEDVKKEVALLAEYIHVNAPVVGDNEQLVVLRSLKLKMTAGKMRQMIHKTRDMFDFLKSYSPRKIYDLIADESARSQAVVLIQLPTEKRRAVFELFEGNLKADLLRELCVKESLPREYLFNIAQALKRKIDRLGTTEGEMLGGADVIIDLIERADRESQNEMMENLDNTNYELARQVRSRLVSVETLHYLSDGLLLEIFLSLEPQMMVTFLAGTRDRIRQLILNKAPEEVAADWNDSAATIRGLDGESFRLAEMQVLGKIRAFAAGGLINLAELNEVIYPRTADSDREFGGRESLRSFRISNPVVA